MLYQFRGRCGHAWDVEVQECTLPGCNCGNPRGALEPGPCPECGRPPQFFEIPMWMHIGIGYGNVAAIMKLELTYGDSPEGEE